MIFKLLYFFYVAGCKHNFAQLQNTYITNDGLDKIFLRIKDNQISNMTNILSKINNECKNSTILIIESYTKPLIQLKCLYTFNITYKHIIYIYKL